MARALPQALLELSDIADIDELDRYADRLARWSVELAPVTAAAVVLRNAEGTRRVGAAHPPWARALPEAAIAGSEGMTAEPWALAEPMWLDVAEQEWPQFSAVASELGIGGGFAVPLRHRGRLFGVLGVYCRSTEDDRPDIEDTCTTLAGAASIGIANLAEFHRLRALVDQLQTALDTRIVIEQAKGIIAERRRTGVDQAFALLRRLARENNLRLHDVARATVDTLKSGR